MIDVVRELRIEVTHGVVRQCREMNHRVEAVEVRHREVTKVFSNLWNLFGRLPELAACKQVCIEAKHLVIGGLEDRSGNRTDVSFMAGQKYLHLTPTQRKVRGRRGSASIEHS